MLDKLDSTIQKLILSARSGVLLSCGMIVACCLLLGSTVAQAAIGTTSQNWPATPIYSAAAYPTSISYNAVAGTNRLLVVGISSSSSAVNQPQPTVSYGGVGMTYAVGTNTTVTQQHSYLFYLPLGTSGTADTGKSIAITMSGGTSVYCIVNAAVYTGVDQSAPLATSVRSSNNTTASNVVGPFTIAVNSGEMGISVLNAVSTGKTNAPTITIGTTGHLWSQVSTAASSKITGSLRTTFATTLNTNAATATQHSSTGQGGAATLNSTAAIVIKPIQGVTVADGSTVAGNKSVFVGAANATNVVIDAFTMNASAATNVTGFTFTSNANTVSSKISAIKIWRKVGASLTAWEASDVLVAHATPNGGAVAMTMDLANEPVTTVAKNYIVTYDVSGSATASTATTFTGNLTSITPAAIAFTDTLGLSANLYIYPTTTVGNGVEPPAVRLPKSSQAQNLNAFTLVHNSTNVPADDDPITYLSFTMTPPLISGGTAASSKIKLMEVVSEDGLTVYGSLTAPTSAIDNLWTISTPTLKATSTLTTYYLRVSTADTILPSVEDTSGTATGYYEFGGSISGLTHDSNHLLAENDSSSQTLIIDVEKPYGPGTATATTGTTGGTIDLTWDDTSYDDHTGTLHPSTPYVIRRDFTQPLAGCTTGTAVTLTPANQTSRTLTDTGLIDTVATRYFYRICAMDAQGNISNGTVTEAFSKVSNICNLVPTITLKAMDNSDTQIIKSFDKEGANNIYFNLTVLNNDIGVCPDVTYSIELANEQASKLSGSFTPDIANFNKNIDGVDFPKNITVGTGAPGSGKVATAKIYVTGKASANQLEQYIFAAKATNGAIPGSPFISSQVTGLLNDMPPIVHNNSNMGKSQYGNWGQEFTCATCHSISTTNIKGVYTVISTGKTGRRSVVFSKTSTVTNDYDGVFGNDLRPNKDTSNYVCAVCHTRTRQHQYSASKAAFNNEETGTGVAGRDGNEYYQTNHHNSRDCMKCHTHNTAFRSIYGVCGDCHGWKSTQYAPYNAATMVKENTLALGNPAPNGGHQRHNIARIKCIACHSNSNHSENQGVWQGDDKIDMGFTINMDTFPGFNSLYSFTTGVFNGTDSLNQNPINFSWNGAPGTTINLVPSTGASCNTYCHGQWTGNEGALTTPDWVTPGQAACGTCHNATAAAPPVSGSHAKHAGNTGGGLGIACNRCHATYGSYTGSAHINGNVQWKLTNLGSQAAYKGSSSGSTGAPAPTTAYGAYGACTNIYCHSNIQGPAGSGGPTTYADPPPQWGGTVACGSCHEEPNHSGSHASHENATVSFDCHVCHNNGGYTSPQNHANGNIDFQFVGLGQNTQYMGGTTSVPAGTPFGTCSNSNCHGNYTRAWGTPASALDMCDKCHGSATSPRGFYNTRGPDGTLSIYSAAIGVHDIHLQNPNSPRKATFNRFTSYAKGFTCRQCHSLPKGPFSEGHVDTALPAEVLFTDISSIARTGQTKFSYYTSAYYTSADQTCNAVWCHGAGMNSNNGSGPYEGLAPAVQRAIPAWNAPYLTGNSTTDCTKCHAMPPPAPNSTYVHFGLTMAQCSGCHLSLNSDASGFKNKALHVNGKIDGGCTGCHGYPPIANTLGGPDGLAIPDQGALRLGTAGAHNAHILNMNIGKRCDTCHQNYNAEMTSDGTGQLELGFNGFNGAVVSGTFTGYSDSGLHPKWRAGNAGTEIQKVTSGANVCSNLYCHGGGTGSLPALGGGSKTTPNWEGGSGDAICGTCHGADASVAVPSGGSHVKHALATGGGPGILCSACHKSVSNMNHVDGAVSWYLDHDNPVIGANATYDGISSGRIVGLAPRSNGADYRNCNNVYCHSTVQGANGIGEPTYFPVKWGDSASVHCGSCHVDMAINATGTGSHKKHANTDTGAGNMGLSCGYCHQDGGDGSLNHADKIIFVNFTSYVGGTYSNNGRTAGDTAGYGTCSATFCHGTRATPPWGSPSLVCTDCHGASADKSVSTSWSGRHSTHYNYSTAPGTYNETLADLSSTNKYRFNCKHCHDTDATKHSLKPYSSMAYARVFFGISSAGTAARRGKYVYGTAQGGTDNGFKYTAGSCNTSYCHSNGQKGNPLVTSLTWTSPKIATQNCLYCHDTKSTTSTASQLSPKHDRHMNPARNTMIGTGNGFSCADCHAQTVFKNLSVGNKTNHVNGMADYSGAKANKNYNSATKVCSNVYCHSNGNPNAVVFVSMTGSKVWSGSATITTCNACHGRSNSLGYPDYASGAAASPTANLHAGHLAGMSDTTACADCHRKTADTITVNKFRPYSTTHLSGGPNVNFNTVKNYIGTKATWTQAGASCSNVICHGQGAPVWGAQTTANTCQKCHGSRSTAFQTYTSAQVAPGYATDGYDTSMVKKDPTDARVGAHQKHLSSSAISSRIMCRECHVPVTAIRSGNHWNYSTATLTFTGRATGNGHTTAGVSRNVSGIMQCSNTWCHTGKYNSGNYITPFWTYTGLVKEAGTTVAACTKCHAMPPTAYVNHPQTPLSDTASLSTVYASCGSCHTNLRSSGVTNVGNVFTDKTLHVNGTINYVSNCNNCHAYDITDGGTTWNPALNSGSGTGAHIKHIVFIKSRLSIASLTPTGQSFGAGETAAVCGTCHSNSTGDHSMDQSTNTRQIYFGSGGSFPNTMGSNLPGNMSLLFGSGPTPYYNSTDKSCSNLSCHYFTTPSWY